MSSKKTILIICNSILSREPRVIRQIMALKETYSISTIGLQPSGISGIEHYKIDLNAEPPKHLNYHWFLRKTYSATIKVYDRLKEFYINQYFENDYWNAKRKELVKKFQNKHFDVIIAHHWDSLPIATSIANKKTKLVFNAHDYYTREFENNKLWTKYVKGLIEYTMAKHLPNFDLIFAAWNKIKEDFEIKYKVPTVVINNATEFNDLFPALNNDKDSIKIIHHGIANSDRQIEKMIEMMDYLDERFSLDLMLIYSDHEKQYFDFLKEKSKNNAKIKFIEPVATREIAKHINKYDIGLFLLPLNGFNPTFLLPNKLFEFIQARLACLVTPNIEMKKIVEQYNLGWVSKNFEPSSVATEIINITQVEINVKKLNAHKYAKDLSAEKNYTTIQKNIDKLLQEGFLKEEIILSHRKLQNV